MVIGASVIRLKIFGARQFDISLGETGVKRFETLETAQTQPRLSQFVRLDEAGRTPSVDRET
jgi:hypothetical protein